MKKIFSCLFFILAATFIFAQNVDFSDYTLEADVLMKKNDPNPSKLAWRNILFAPNIVVEGDNAEFLLKVNNLKKGYSGFTLYQPDAPAEVQSKTVSVSTNGKEQKFVPGKVFSKAGGLIWISFTAPDKKKYSLPTDIRILTSEEYENYLKSEFKKTQKIEEIIFEALENSNDESNVVSEIAETTETEEETESEISDVENPGEVSEIVMETSDSSEEIEEIIEESNPEDSVVEKGEYKFVRDSRNLPKLPSEEIASFVGMNKQAAEKETNVQVLVRNLPDGTKPKLFFMNGMEVLVYIAPDLTLRADDNCYSLFYSTRRYGRDEDFSAPKRVVENPKINGKLTNMLDFDGIVTTVGGKQKLLLCWTQCTIQVTEETFEEDLFKKTGIYWSSWKENDKSWEKVECISEIKGSLQFDPVLSNGVNGVCLRVRNRPDNTLFSDDNNPAFAEKQLYFLLNKKGVWENAGSADFLNIKEMYPITDENNSVSNDLCFVSNRDGSLAGCMWNCGSEIFIKTYLKSPETKKMMWTESVSVIYQKKGGEGEILYPHAAVRDTGDWIVTYLLKTETGNKVCVSKVNNEPCMVTRNLKVDLRDMQKPGNTVHFSVEVENLGIGIAQGMDVVIKNEFKTEAGVVSYKNNFYPGTKYQLNGVYQKLKGKDGIVPVEEIYADVKFPKMKKNSEFAYYDARFTLGIPKLAIGDMFVSTKGKSQKVIFTLGTSNGIKVKAPATEVVITEHVDNPDYEDNIVSVPVENYFSDEYYEMSYEYETSELDEKSFDFDVLFHYEAERRKFPGWKPEDIELETAVTGFCKVWNPVYTKPSFYVSIMNTSFVKKTKVITVDFVVANNWAEMISENLQISLVNTTTGAVEQTLEIPFSLDVLQNKKGTVSFEPALSENAADYIVQVSKN